jgi:hypothetical protein
MKPKKAGMMQSLWPPGQERRGGHPACWLLHWRGRDREAAGPHQAQGQARLPPKWPGQQNFNDSMKNLHYR